MPEPQTDPDVYVLYDGRFVRTPAGRGDELRLHLESHGVRSRVTHLRGGAFDRVDLVGDVDPVTVQAVLDHWER